MKRPPDSAAPSPDSASADFIRRIVATDLAEHGGGAVTRFPPEPNGYLHIGHAKSMCLNFGVAGETGGLCRLRFDDTNPLKESREFADAIRDDVRWLGFGWEGEPRHASDYFEEMYGYALGLVRSGFAYVDSQSAAEIRETRGTLTRPGEASPWRDRPAAESAELFARMRGGEFPDGAHVLRARIDMASGNLNLRDPVLYRIRHATHPHTGDAWCIYPTYDFAQVLSDAIEGVTHSLCTLEFEDHRPLYDWILDHADPPSRPRQIEFSRLNLEHTVMSKRRLAELVEEGHVDGWSDPRMPTLRGMRRRGYPPAAIRDFCERVGNHPEGEPYRDGSPGTVRPRRARPPRPPGDGGAAPAPARHRQLARGRDRGARRAQPPPRPRRRRPQGALRPRAVDRTGRLHGGAGAGLPPPLPGAGGAASLRLHRPVRVVRGPIRRRARSRPSAAPTIPPPAAARPRMGGRCAARFTGSPRSARRPRSSGSTTGCSRPPIRADRRTSTRARSRWSRMRGSRHRSPPPGPASASSSSGSGISAATRISVSTGP